ncbi:MAG: hypothetical protein PHV32_12470 [Eubacteriales bacterium]|nr:hypothetical protein [Eubacteriales bacterium]
MLKRIICLLIIVGMLPMFGVIGLASDTKPRVTGSASDPLSGYYVIYEYDGNSYRSDEMGSAFNRNMWRLLDDTDRQKVVSALSYRSQRVSQFGSDGNDLIMDWYKESNEWSQAKRLWEQKLAGKHFPLLEGFYNGSLSEYYSCYNENPVYQTGSDKALYDSFYEKRAEMNDYWNIGKTAYGVLGRMKGKQVAVAVNFGSKEIIKMLTDTYFMPAATRGAKPLSDALGQALGIAADQGMGMLSAPPSPWEQIASIEKLINECKNTAETVMNDKLPTAAAELCDLLNQIQESEQKHNEEYIKQQQQQYQASEDRQIQTENIIDNSYQEATDYVECQISLIALANTYVPTIGDTGATENDYISFRNWFTGQVSSFMEQIRTEFDSLATEYEAFRTEYDGYKDAILAEAQLETLPGSAFELSMHIYTRQDRFLHPVAGMPDMYRKMIDVNPEEVFMDFSADLFTYYGYAENVPYFVIVRDRFFNEDEEDYRDLIEEYEAFANVLQPALDFEDEFFTGLSDIHGKIEGLKNKIISLQNLYQNRTNPSNYGWHTVGSVAPVSEFFAPLYPAESNVYPTSDISTFMTACENEFRLYFKAEQQCQNYITEYTKSIDDLDIIKTKYMDVLNNYLNIIRDLGTQYRIAAANYENALSQVYSSIKGILESENEYVGNFYSSSYTYDGKFISNISAYPLMDMRKIQDDIDSSSNKETERQRILNRLKSLKSQEEAHLRRFETAKAHQQHYGEELNRISSALGLSSTGQKASVLYVLGESDIETSSEVMYRLFPEYNARDLVTNYSVENVNGSNLHHAIEMLEGKTENYYKLQHYKRKISEPQTSPSGAMLLESSAGVSDNMAKSVYKASQSIYLSGRTSTITFAQENIQSGYFALLDTLEQTGVDYTEAPLPVIRITDVVSNNGEITATIENESGGSVENASIILAEYTSNGTFIRMSFQKITKIDNLYSEIKTFSTHEGVSRFKIMLWQDIVRLSPLADVYDSTLH